MSNLIPEEMNRTELLAIIDDMTQRIKAGDSWEGHIEYLMPTEEDGEVEAEFMVRGVYRTGLSRRGQGGTRMIGTETKLKARR